MQVVFVSGAAATGKSTIAKHLASHLRYDYLSKDVLKEYMFDTLKQSTHRYNFYEHRAKSAFFKHLNTSIKSKSSLVIESNFTRADRKRLAKFLTPGLNIVEIYCTTRGLVNFKRFVHRNEDGKRHVGHHDRKWYFSTLINTLLAVAGIHLAYPPLRLSAATLSVDTTDFSQIDYLKIEKFIRKSLVSK